MNPPVRVLVVDHEPGVRLMVREGLEIAGYEVLEASDAREANESVQVFSPDLVLLDLTLPGVSGLEELQALRQATRDQSPVIVFTANGAVHDGTAALTMGAADFVAKPLRPEVLRRAVLGALSRAAADSREIVGTGSDNTAMSDHLASARLALGPRADARAESSSQARARSKPRGGPRPLGAIEDV